MSGNKQRPPTREEREAVGGDVQRLVTEQAAWRGEHDTAADAVDDAIAIESTQLIAIAKRVREATRDAERECGFLAETARWLAADRDAARQELREAEAHIAALRGPLLHHFGTTDPELLAEIWQHRAEVVCALAGVRR